MVVALATLADRLDVGGDDQESAARRVLDLLGDRADVLLVYDNADAPEELAGLLPTGRCRVLLTSRNPEVAAIAEPVAVEPFTPSQAARFLRLRTGDTDKAAADRLADSTGCLPLALEQIAGYCAASDIGLADYADRYRTGRRSLLRAKAPSGRAPVEVAIGLALADVRRRSAAAAQLVRLASYLGHVDGVPRELLAAVGRGSPPELVAAAADPIALDRVIAVVRRTSLVTGRGGRLRMHPLVGDIIRDGIRDAPRWLRIVRAAVARIPPRDRTAGWGEERWIDVAASTIAAALPPDSDDAATWPAWAALLPHALACLDHAEAADLRSVSIGFIGNEFGLYLRRRGQYAEAQELFRVAASNYARSAGRTHPETLHAMNNLAGSFLDHGQVADAAALHEDTYRTRVTLLGAHHRDTLASANNLAEALRRTGDPDRARALFHDVLTGSDDALEQATATNNLATVAQDVGDFDEARELYRSALRVQTEVLGEDHPDSLITRANLADLLRAEGRLAEAHEEHALILRTRTDVLGAEHPSTLLSAVNVALVLRELGRPAEAGALHRDAVAGLSGVLGDDHPLTTTARGLV